MDFYGTLGPACQEECVLYQMFQEGMTGLRLNLSHKPLAACGDWITQMHQAAKQAGIQAQLLIDLQGPELRVGQFEEPLMLEEGQLWSASQLKLPESTMPYLTVGQPLLLDDGKLLAKAVGVHAAGTEGMKGPLVQIVRGGRLASRKSIALPGVTVPSPTLTEADLENLRVASQYGVTGVMLPFVRSAQDLITLREELQAAGAPEIRIYAKLESMEGVRMLEELLPYTDEIVIARGDLGNCMDLWRLPAVQKKVAAVCRRAGKPFMVVTQMLASMEHMAVPTRAEVSDIFNAVLDGASSVMVTGETAVGEYPVEVMRYLVKTSQEALAYQE
ncbi:MAG: pyruvate kinase [Lachnospiraceae bacterium]|nr:pyruvate kinase [Lachnospiraceae bacterium]